MNMRWPGCNKVQRVGGDRGSLFNLQQAAAEMGGATRRCCLTDSLIQQSECQISLLFLFFPWEEDNKR